MNDRERGHMREMPEELREHGGEAQPIQFGVASGEYTCSLCQARSSYNVTAILVDRPSCFLIFCAVCVNAMRQAIAQ